MKALDSTFSALADPTRRAILARLALGEASVGELAAPFAISGPAISRHLRVLETARLIKTVRRGKQRRCSLLAEGLHDASDWIGQYRHFWTQSFDRLDELISTGPAKDGEQTQ